MKTNLGSTGYSNILAFSGILVLLSKEQSKKNTLRDIMGQSYKSLEKVKIKVLAALPSFMSQSFYSSRRLPGGQAQFSLYKSILTTPNLLVVSMLENGCEENLLHHFPRD